jgi:Bacterial PH domain
VIAVAASRHELRYYAPMGRAIAEFSAPWSRSLRLVTTCSVVVLLSLALVGLSLGPRQSLLWCMAMVGAPLVVLVGALLFMVRGYVLTESRIEVQRLGWNTFLPLAGLVAVQGEPQGLRGSLRLFGNGGLFAISGWFWNRRIGRFRAYATDPERTVLLRYRDGRKVVVTPHDVQHFIVRVRKLANIV